MPGEHVLMRNFFKHYQIFSVQEEIWRGIPCERVKIQFKLCLDDYFMCRRLRIPYRLPESESQFSGSLLPVVDKIVSYHLSTKIKQINPGLSFLPVLSHQNDIGYTISRASWVHKASSLV